ncbi:alpha/beta-hydrolase [Aspergillus indologenus CBS 114.80]|uniref:Alpha/beta-hydrolase n=1 Tax=Aspergillus indologenus CBS 114.80 TaxID=1450541 RepID=A0A2V5J4X7_9EURO|nr:alpha/beta-hydrolase [Aspergillus indologenus CBS 114.80]
MDSIFQVQGSAKSQLAPLFLIHAISGSALPYNSLGALDSRGRAIYAISSPLYGPRRYRLPSSIDDVARQYLRLVRSKQTTGPYVLGGRSFGGIVALKMAEMLSAQEETILKLTLVDTSTTQSFSRATAW